MTDIRKTGMLGEKISLDYLLSKGYKIIERNWRKSRYELDLIVSVDDTLVFVEVKSGHETDYGPPELKVDSRKQKRIVNAATEYLANIEKMPHEIRFDVIVVINPNSDNPLIDHIESAFTADFD